MVTGTATGTGADERRTVVFCETCGGHVGIAGSFGEHCDDTSHDYQVDHCGPDAEQTWIKFYAREARTRQLSADAEIARRATPLLERLRACGVRRASDGILSISTPDCRDAHDAADVIDELLALSGRLLDPAAQSAALERLSALRSELGAPPAPEPTDQDGSDAATRS